MASMEITFSEQIDVGNWTTAPLRLSLSAIFHAQPGTVFDALSNPKMMCRILPGIDRIVIESGSAAGTNGVGAVRTCTLDSGLILREEITHWQPPHRYAFRGLEEEHPLGMRDHLSVLALDSRREGTRLIWKQYFNHSNLPLVSAQLQQSMETTLAKLIMFYGGRIELAGLSLPA
jgi:carbon monoxide dehydrogenase subunit G